MQRFLNLRKGGDNLVNKNRLMGIIVSAGYTQTSFAREIGMNKDTFSLKINNKSDFKTGEIERICDVLHITKATDKVAIFLAKPSQKCNA